MAEADGRVRISEYDVLLLGREGSESEKHDASALLQGISQKVERVDQGRQADEQLRAHHQL